MTTAGSGSIDGEAIEVAVKLHHCICKQDVCGIDKLYKRLSMLQQPLPCVQDVAKHVDEDYLFCSLYIEIWYRRLSSPQTLEQRVDSWCNYCRLLQDVLPRMLYTQLPYEWLWDMVDEFVNQFQSFCEYRALQPKSQEDINLLKIYHEAWTVFRVLHILESLRDVSSIIQILEQEAKDDGGLQLLTSAAADDRGGSNVPKVLGYFSMVALLRVHCLLGNYQTGLDCLLPIDLSQQGFYTSLIATHVTTIYHYGFANLMLGRYVEAIREFNKFLVKTNMQNDQILDKMYALLAICLSLCPPQLQLIDENVNSKLMEKYGEQLSRMQRYNDVAFYRELLSYAWPIFSTPFAPSSGDLREIFSKDELADYDEDVLAISYPEFFEPFVSSYVVNHIQLEAVIDNMLKLKPK